MFDEKKYIELLGLMESGNNYSIENSSGYLGRYQFGTSTLNSLQNTYNLPAWKNKTYFLSNPNLQDTYIKALIKDTLNFIARNNLAIYNGRVVSGSMRFKTIQAPLNIYGMLAAAHLAGAPALKKFLINGTNPNDGLTSLSDYAAYFSSVLNSTSNIFPLLLAFIPAIILYYL